LPDDRATRRRFDHAHRIEPVAHAPFAPPRPIGNLRIGPGRPRRPARLGRGGWLLVVVAVAILGIALVGGPVLDRPSMSTAEAPTPTPSARAVAGAPDGPGPTPEPTLGPIGNDLPLATDPPIDRNLVRNLVPLPPSQLTGYQWPIDHARITNAFGLGRPGGYFIDGVELHDGIDVSSFCGARIVAAHDGKVLAAGRHHEGYVGWPGDLSAFRAKLDAENAWYTRAIAVVIDDGNGYRSIYLHLAKAAVSPGDVVHAGDFIGWEGQTGYATGCHLHYSIFSPLERATYQLDPKVAARSELPGYEIARIDPLLVLPPLSTASITWGWGARD
jgi:murein DD-endopeptidase MepM/ murein hydrolase activator NlpD